MHGITMIFFFVTPMLFGFGNYFLPLMLGASVRTLPSARPTRMPPA